MPVIYQLPDCMKPTLLRSQSKCNDIRSEYLEIFSSVSVRETACRDFILAVVHFCGDWNLSRADSQYSQFSFPRLPEHNFDYMK